MKSLDELIQKNMSVKFRCRPAGDKSGEFTSETQSILNPPSPDELDSIKEKLSGISTEIIEFYEKHNGAVFHFDSGQINAGLLIHPIREWDEVTSEMMEWYDMMDEDVIDELDMEWLDDCIAFAEVPSSANYFVLVVNGENKGKVIYTDHEVAEPEVYAHTFNEFLARYLSKPVDEMMSLGCFTRYSDGKTDIQWIPSEII